MKIVQTMILLMVALLWSNTVGYAQSLVSTEPRNRTIVLEEFTGLNCGYCPDGHRIANGIKNKYNGEPILINVHVGSFANPGAGQPDYRTAFGTELDAQAKVTGYPSATVNRHFFLQYGTTLALNRGYWEATAAEIAAMPSPVNVGLRSTFDKDTRKLTVDVEAFYTADEPFENTINVVLTESDVIGYQSDYTNGSHTDYHHMHMLRYMLSGQWGEDYTTTTKGTLVKKTYTYTVPANFNIANCHVAAFISENTFEILTGAEVPADGGTTMVTSSIKTESATVVTNDKLEAHDFAASVLNKLPASEAYTFTATQNTPKGWVGKIMVNNSVYTGGEVTIDASAAKDIVVSLSPEAVPGVGSIEVTVHSKTYPLSPVVKKRFYLMSGVSDLLLSHPDAVKYDSVYTETMVNAKLAKSGVMDRNVFELFADAKALNGVKNVYYNVSWAFPGITEPTLNTIKGMLDKGVNLFIAGQDFAWDVASGDTNAHGNTVTKDFLNTYLMTKFIADGNSGNSLFTAIKTTPIFGTIPNSTVTNPYGGNNLYPEQIEPMAGATAAFSYNNSVRIGGLYGYRNGYKVVYLGVGLEQLSANTRSQIMDRTAKWFNGEISNVEFDDIFAAKVQVYPIPANNQLTVTVPETMVKGNVVLYAANGSKVKEVSFENLKSLDINIEDIASGAYRITVENIYGGKIATGMVSVVR